MQIDKLLMAGIISCAQLFISCSSKKIKNDGLRPLELSAEIGKWETVRTYNFAPVFITLINNTSDTLRYVSMSCLWQYNYTLDTNILTIYPEICDKNIPVLMSILPHGKERKVLFVATERNVKWLEGVEFKVGFYWLSAKKGFEAYEKINQMQDNKNLIWSAPLQIR